MRSAVLGVEQDSSCREVRVTGEVAVTTSHYQRGEMTVTGWWWRRYGGQGWGSR
jgi:hypothetical protein